MRYIINLLIMNVLFYYQCHNLILQFYNLRKTKLTILTDVEKCQNNYSSSSLLQTQLKKKVINDTLNKQQPNLMFYNLRKSGQF